MVSDVAQFDSMLHNMACQIENPDHSVMYNSKKGTFYCSPVIMGGKKIGTLIAVGDKQNENESTQLIERMIAQSASHRRL